MRSATGSGFDLQITVQRVGGSCWGTRARAALLARFAAEAGGSPLQESCFNLPADRDQCCLTVTLRETLLGSSQAGSGLAQACVNGLAAKRQCMCALQVSAPGHPRTRLGLPGTVKHECQPVAAAAASMAPVWLLLLPRLPEMSGIQVLHSCGGSCPTAPRRRLRQHVRPAPAATAVAGLSRLGPTSCEPQC